MITSYGTLLRMPALAETHWRFVVLDEAQAIKNPDAKQTRAAKALQGRGAHRADRHAGREPPGRSVVDLRFHQPGPARDRQAVRALRQRPGRAAAQPLRPAARAGAALHPAADEDRQVRHRRPAGQDRGQGVLPLSRKQAALYEQAVTDLAEALEDAEGIQRKGIVLATLMRLKQICNHPSQWLRRRRLGRGGQRQVGPPARDRRGGGGAAGEDAGLHPVPRDDGAAGGLPGRGLRARRAGAARRDRGQEPQGAGADAFRRTRPCRSSCCR